MALMYARLVVPPPDYAAPTRTACERIVRAVTTYPELVGGAGERLDTEGMRATRGRGASKIGAEGVYTACVRPSAEWPRGLGLALKIEDGENLRARPTVVIESLRQLGVLDETVWVSRTLALAGGPGCGGAGVGGGGPPLLSWNNFAAGRFSQAQVGHSCAMH